MKKNHQDLVKLKEDRDQTQETMKKYMEATMTMEMDRASHVLRFRNILEDREQDLTQIITDLLANALGWETDDMKLEIDQVYRINSKYAKIKKVPREVQVIFIRKTTRDKILKVANDNPLRLEGKEIQVMKQTPWKIREMRKKYLFLTNKLNYQNITFR